ncbi:ABC transporter permease [Paenibacillus doosanensis]|uniref:Glutathione transport system permease protein GsiC n=1 Tax=Paenibacillus konkukensis TaxID=2020716 RepID=A0ABY4RPP9_9BACL|nr:MULTISPECIES: ABC transporter permease [Paenibacillus]MCS7464156.1 ABC transporter permease [Paenibacillus doosanensis]UQZ83786.1 Glutathione transport system permease protein GsiC [Paenibacillus konkukensis]
MHVYMGKRLLQLIPTLLGASLVIFFIFALAPGDFIDSDITLTPERAAELKALYGLDKPLMERYFIWLGNALKGDLGYSLQYQQPVMTVLKEYMLNSFLIAGVSLILTWIIAVMIGVFSATRQYSWYDSLITLGVFAAMSFPSFFIGLLMIKWFAVDLGWLPIGGILDTGSQSAGAAYLLEIARHMVLPATVLTMLSVGSLTRHFRANMIDVIKQDFVRTARAKGLKERTVVYKHALRNALLPAITLLGLELPGLFSGAIITERIFTWPGVGYIHMEAISNRDYTILMGFTMFLAVLTVIGNLLADWLYAAADPRIRLK